MDFYEKFFLDHAWLELSQLSIDSCNSALHSFVLTINDNNIFEKPVAALDSVLVLSTLLVLYELMSSQSDILGEVHKDSSWLLHVSMVPQK